MLDKEIILSAFKEEIQRKLKIKQEEVRELEERIKKAEQRIENASDLKNIQINHVSILARLFDIAKSYELLGDKDKESDCYEKIIRIREKYPENDILMRIAHIAYVSLGRYEESLEIMEKSKNSIYYGLGYARIYEKMEDIEKAREIYAHEAQEYERTAGKERWHQGPHYFQTASDLWEKVGNSGKAKECNEKAIEIWNERKEEMEKVSSPLRLAWLYEEIGYIYFKAKDFETARKYYDMSEKMYKKAYNKKYLSDSEFIRCDDDDWNKEIGEHFFEITSLFIFDENQELWISNEADLRRIKYRKLLLEKEMKEITK